MVRCNSVRMKDSVLSLYVSLCPAFPKDFQNEAHPRQGLPPEPVSIGRQIKERGQERLTSVLIGPSLSGSA